MKKKNVEVSPVAPESKTPAAPVAPAAPVNKASIVAAFEPKLTAYLRQEFGNTARMHELRADIMRLL